MTTLDAQRGAALKQAGQQLALSFSGPWADEVIAELRAWLKTRKAQGLTDMTVEEFRAQCANMPSSSQAWGSIPRLACKAGLIAPMRTSDGHRVYRNAAAPRTRSHPVAVYVLGAVA